MAVSFPISIYFVNAMDIDINVEETTLHDVREAAHTIEEVDSAGQALRILADYINDNETSQDYVYIVSNGVWEEVIHSPFKHLNV